MIVTAPPPIDSLTDRELVSRYVRLRDEIAFAALVRRYSSLVLGICQRVLAHRQDVEDAFQATFLVLARDAHRVKKRDSLASWLHGVAYRTSVRAAESRHRRVRLLKDVAMIESDGNSLAEVEHRHQRQLLDEELQSLPDKYRAPLVLHYLESKTAAQVADELKLSVSAVEGRLKRGRKELQLRLARRGLGLSVALAALHLTPSVVTAAEVPTLVGSTIHAGLSYTAGDPAGPLFTHEAARLAAQETLAMTATTTATLTALLLVPVALALSSHGDGVAANGSQRPIATTVEQAFDQPIMLAAGEVAGKRGDNSAEVKGSESTSLTDHKRITAILGKQISLHHDNATLEEVMNDIAAQSNVHIVLDEIGLRKEGISADALITIDAEGIRIGNALKLLLRPLNVGYFFEGDALLKIIPSTDELIVKEMRKQSFGIESSRFLRNGEYHIALRDSSDQVVLSEYDIRKIFPDYAEFLKHKRADKPVDIQADGVKLEADGLQLNIVGRSDVSPVVEDHLQANPLPRRWYFTDQPENVRRIEQEMSKNAALQFVDMPLSDAIDFIAQEHHITIIFDEVALADAGVPTDEPINLIIDGVKLKSALDLILRPLELDYIFRDEVMTITTREVAEDIMEMRVYDLRQLPSTTSLNIEDLIFKSIEGPWQNPSSEQYPQGTKVRGTIASFDGNKGVVVRHNARVHRQIVDLLEQLQRHAEAGAENGQLQSSAARPHITPDEAPPGSDEKTTVMYDIRKLADHYDGIGNVLEEISQRTRPLNVSFGGGIMADHLIAVTTPEQHRVLRMIIDRMLAQETETE